MSERKITKKKKHSRLNYSIDALKDALKDIAKGTSIKTASAKYKVPFSTLRCKHKGIYPIGKKNGRGTVLTKNEEQELVSWMTSMSKAGFPLTKDMLLDSVAEILKKVPRDHPFTNGRPGKRWFEYFIKRHPELSLRTPQNLSQRRAQVIEEDLRRWFKEVEDHLRSKNLLHIDGSRIFICGESAFVLNPKGNKVLIEKKSRTVYNSVGNNDIECLTALVTGNAAGQMVPPMIVYSYQRIPAVITEKLPDDWAIGISDNGWMTSETFYEYITNIFYPWCVQNGIEFPVIMYMDGHSSHATLELSNFCVAHNIELVSLYPNSTHITQPVDIAIFRPLKISWEKAVAQWRMNNNGLSLRKSDFAPVLKTAIELTDVQKSLRSGFSCCGLFPFSADSVNYSKLLNNHGNTKSSLTVKSNTKFSNMDFDSTLKIIEDSVSPETVNLFKIAAKSNEGWFGEEEYKQLFNVWLKCYRVINPNLNSSEEESLVDVISMNENIDCKTNVNDESIVKSSVDSSSIVQEIIMDSSVDLNNLDLSNLEIIVLKDDTECNNIKNASIENVKNRLNSSEPHVQTLIEEFSTTNSHDFFEENMEKPIYVSMQTSIEDPLDLTSSSNSIYLPKHDENSSPNKNADSSCAVRDILNGPFLHPEHMYLSKNNNKKRSKGNISHVDTSSKWREQERQKIVLKKEMEEDKEQKEKLEICVDCVESITNAVNGGADRLELCSALSEGGLTPTIGLAKFAKTISPIPVFAMIRARGGDFVYSQEEIEIMLDDIKHLKSVNIDGFVFGALTATNDLDVSTCKKIIEAAAPLPVTFHRAFDQVNNPISTLEKIRDLGFTRILTSGQKNSALDGSDLIVKLIERAGDDIIVMPGAGITEKNLSIIRDKTGAKEFHGSAKRNSSEVAKAGSVTVTDPETVKLMVKILKEKL